MPPPHPRDEVKEVQDQIRALFEEFHKHLEDDRERNQRDRQRDETLARIEGKVDGFTTKFNEWQGMGKLAKAIFFGIGPIVAGLLWLKEHFKW